MESRFARDVLPQAPACRGAGSAVSLLYDLADR